MNGKTEQALDPKLLSPWLYFELFKTFFILGASTIGGGIVMIPLIERELVNKKQWISSEDFMDMMGLIQSVPGAVAVNSAAITGYRLGKFPAAFSSVIGSILPSFFAILLIAKLFTEFGHHPMVQKFLQGARPAVVALLIYASYSLGKKGVVNKQSFLLFLAAFGMLLIGFHPISVIVLAGISGYYLSRQGLI